MDNTFLRKLKLVKISSERHNEKNISANRTGRGALILLSVSRKLNFQDKPFNQGSCGAQMSLKDV